MSTSDFFAPLHEGWTRSLQCKIRQARFRTVARAFRIRFFCLSARAKLCMAGRLRTLAAKSATQASDCSGKFASDVLRLFSLHAAYSPPPHAWRLSSERK
ncbi:hypothetical protein BD626DRAFT_474785 [Schizophyllum amplum]|uniref:Uncharacterized protein n=1 Tax=Schizophyllum amplum TaxID=97359 RepID=A0A550BS43_9AGAR|nr:hypothetical protein BD626DRAFT_528044 [Auriculariopsis ampla]TRM69622.1 hypothetical protein BD626DRAFT_474785 [Auriculariopsis ampla]